MKRKALLIGNTQGLNGVKVDLDKFRAFLLSEIGGSWNEKEIDTLVNPQKITLRSNLDIIRRQQYDYCVVVFSGHGGYLRQTVLEINAQGEKIEESLLKNLSSRQLNIYDCCRVQLRPVYEGYAQDSLANLIRKSQSTVRERYDNRIMQAIPQQASLYSCSIGEASYDTSTGGVYLSNFLDAAKKISPSYAFKTVGLAHQESIDPTQKFALSQGGKQNPDSVLYKCLSEQQLIISIRP
ncbi:MAG: caspase family protein [Methylophilus sp.]|uniref:caspase family protein n=1 Tax=Methylophilus sp. TaxID=29541 RepID=UPI003FA0C2D6